MCQFIARSGKQCTRQGRHNYKGQIYCLRHFNILSKSDTDSINNTVCQINEKMNNCTYWRSNGKRCKKNMLYKDLCKKHFNKIQLMKQNIKNKEKQHIEKNEDKNDKVIELPKQKKEKEIKKELSDEESDEEKEDENNNPILNELLTRIKEGRALHNPYTQHQQQVNKSRGSLFG